MDLHQSIHIHPNNSNGIIQFNEEENNENDQDIFDPVDSNDSSKIRLNEEDILSNDSTVTVTVTESKLGEVQSGDHDLPCTDSQVQNGNFLSDANLLIGFSIDNNKENPSMTKNNESSSQSLESTALPVVSSKCTVESQTQDKSSTTHMKNIKSPRKRKLAADEDSNVKSNKLIKRVMNGIRVINTSWYRRARVSAPKPMADVLQLRPGDDVFLFVDDIKVGSATLQRTFNNESSQKHVKKIHGHDLSKWEKPGPKLVSIKNIKIENAFKSIPSQFLFQIGVEEAPETIGSMYSNGIHPWDALLIQKKKSEHLVT